MVIFRLDVVFDMYSATVVPRRAHTRSSSEAIVIYRSSGAEVVKIRIQK